MYGIGWRICMIHHKWITVIRLRFICKFLSDVSYWSRWASSVHQNICNISEKLNYSIILYPIVTAWCWQEAHRDQYDTSLWNLYMCLRRFVVIHLWWIIQILHPTPYIYRVIYREWFTLDRLTPDQTPLTNVSYWSRWTSVKKQGSLLLANTPMHIYLHADISALVSSHTRTQPSDICAPTALCTRFLVIGIRPLHMNAATAKTPVCATPCARHAAPYQ